MGQIRKHTLGRTEKLKSRKQIDALFLARRSYTQSPVRMYYLIQYLPAPPSAGDTRRPQNETAQPPIIKTDLDLNLNAGIHAGFGSSKKFFKHATKRNRAKRLMREVYRRHKHTLLALTITKHCHLSIFFLFGQKELPSYELIEEKILLLLSQLEKQLQKG